MNVIWRENVYQLFKLNLELSTRDSHFDKVRNVVDENAVKMILNILDATKILKELADNVAQAMK